MQCACWIQFPRKDNDMLFEGSEGFMTTPQLWAEVPELGVIVIVFVAVLVTEQGFKKMGSSGESPVPTALRA